MDTDLALLGRKKNFFNSDLKNCKKKIYKLTENSRVLILGAAGSIGQATAKEVLKNGPKVLHLIDISENNLVELIRDIRSTKLYSSEIKTFVIDICATEMESFIKNQPAYDYILNFAALKHVRSERDEYTTRRMLKVNAIAPLNLFKLISKKGGCKNFFHVSTDKAANPANIMGASKLISEKLLMQNKIKQKITMARFANVAFSDGSLLCGFQNRIDKKQPLSVPRNIERYFMTKEEAGQLCMMSCFLGNNREIFFPKGNDLQLTTFEKIAKKYLLSKNYKPILAHSEREAIKLARYQDRNANKWPMYLFDSDTSGEKSFEEFYNIEDKIDLGSYRSIGIIKYLKFDKKINALEKNLRFLCNKKIFSKKDFLGLLSKFIPEFAHIEKGKNLDERM